MHLWAVILNMALLISILPLNFSSRNGDRYAGEYFGDKIHGFGVYSFANGHCYEGSWHEGKKQGFGMYTFRNGDKRSGDWDSGTLKTPLPPSDPAVQRAVQVIQQFPCAEGSAQDLPLAIALGRNSNGRRIVPFRLLSGPRRTPFACRESTSKSTRRSWPRTGPPRLLVWRRSRLSRTGWMANFAIPMCELLCGRPWMVFLSVFPSNCTLG